MGRPPIKDGGTEMNTLAWLMMGMAACGAGEARWKLTPKHLVGREIVYTGRVVETIHGELGARYEQPYELEANMLVMNVDAFQTAEVGCFTIYRHMDHRLTTVKVPNENLVQFHFDLLKVSSSGRPTWALNDVQIGQSPDGIMPWELGYILEASEEPVDSNSTWEVRRPGQPLITCKVVGRDDVANTPCLKIACTQQSQNWGARRIDQAAWKSEATLWVGRKASTVHRVQRTVSVRDPGDDHAGRTIQADYFLATDLVYQGLRLQERAKEFRAAFKAQTEIEKVSTQIGRVSKSRIEAIKFDLKDLLENQAPTAYRLSIQRLLKQAEALEQRANSREQPTEFVGTRRGAPIGRPARAFVVRNLEKEESFTLKSLQGQAVVLVFIDPNGKLGTQTLSAIAKAVETHGEGVRLLAVCSRADEATLTSLRTNSPGNYTLCSGRGVDKSFGIQGLPHTLFIDGEGILRGSYPGFGPETYPFLSAALKQYGKSAGNVTSKKNTASPTAN